MRSKQMKQSSSDAFFSDFYEQYHRFLYTIVWKHCQDKQLIDDYVQETWTRLLLHQPRLMTLSHEQRVAYISTAVINLFREKARKKHISTCSLDSIPLYTSGGIEAICDHFDAKITKQKFLQLWYQVDADSREILERKILLEESNEEIGRAMNISTNSVRMYLTRAKRAASKVFTPYIRNFI